MPTTDQIKIHPRYLQQIIDQLAALKWNSGLVIIRDTGNQFTVRDKDEGFITEVEKTFDKDDEAHCEGVINFKMSRRLLRFLAVSSHGYWKYDAMATEGYFLPTMSIGKCSPL